VLSDFACGVKEPPVCDPKVEVWAIPAPTGGNRAFCDRMNSWAQGEGQPGLGYIFFREGEEGGAGPVAKNIGPERTHAIRTQLALKVGDAVFFVAGRWWTQRRDA